MSDISLCRKRAGHIFIAYHLLNRPQALNAMTIEMVTTMANALRDGQMMTMSIMLSSHLAQSRAFCAGGDVREAVSVIDAKILISAQNLILPLNMVLICALLHSRNLSPALSMAL